MKKVSLILTLMLMFIITAASVATAATPTTHWYRDWGTGGIDWSNKSDVKEIEDAIRWELYVGYSDGKQIHPKIPGAYYGAALRLGDDITRGEFAVALGRCLDIGSDTNFPMGRVIPLVDQRVITSDEADKDFSVPITRAEMAKWMGRAAINFKADTKGVVSFADTSDSDILAAAKTGVIRGYPDGLFHPDDNAMRAHAVLMLVRFSRQLNSDLPKDIELENLIAETINACNKMIKKRHETGNWDNDVMSGVATERFITNIQEGGEASGRADIMEPNDIKLDEFKVIETHNNSAIFWYSNLIITPDNKSLPGSSYGLNYAKKINGRWVISSEIPTFQKY
jgi:hypothetical protein